MINVPIKCVPKEKSLHVSTWLEDLLTTIIAEICTIKAQMRNCTTPRLANTRNGLKFLSNYSFVPLCSFSLLLKLKLHWERNFWEHFYCECTSCLPSLAPSSDSGEEAQIDGLSGNEQRPSFGLHCRCTIFRLDLVMLHQLQSNSRTVLKKFTHKSAASDCS